MEDVQAWNRYDPSEEPSAEAACQWWPDLTDIWTPVGWRDHLFRFNVFFNGMVLAQPDLNPRTSKWAGQGLQAAFAPSWDGSYRNFVRAEWDLPPTYATRDSGAVQQGWRNTTAPILWSEWVQEGVRFRQEIFAHVAGGQKVTTGIEPLFAWIRLSIVDVCRPLPVRPDYGFVAKLNAPHVGGAQFKAQNLRFFPEKSQYPRVLSPQSDASQDKGWRLLEDTRIRLGIAPGYSEIAKIRYTPQRPTPSDALLFLPLPTREEANVDLLLPMLPMERGEFDRELALGFDGALREAEAFWQQSTQETRVRTPEPLVNEVIRHSVRFQEITSETNPETGWVSMLSGSFKHANLWATPGAMTLVMLLDAMGRHETVDRYLEIFRHEQGAGAPPSKHLDRHPGYLSTVSLAPPIPAYVQLNYTHYLWLNGHGAILWAVCQHALWTDDAAFIGRWTPGIVKACEFIRDARARRDHPGEPGLMPPAVATDGEPGHVDPSTNQLVWNDGWMFKGLATAVRLLRKLGHPAAETFGSELRDYRETFVKAFRAKAAAMPRWTDGGGQHHPLVPPSQVCDTIDEFYSYVDYGPMFLTFAGLLDAEDELMRASLLWCREGPPTRFHRDGVKVTDSLVREMSSWYAGMSWNVFHNRQLGDRRRYLEGMYSLFAGGVSRQTYISCEQRGGNTGSLRSATLAVWLARLAVIDDQIEDDALHLLRLVPLAWVQPDQETVFHQMPTEFGPVNLRFKLSADRTSLVVAFAPTFRTTPKRIVLHLPPHPELKRLEFNGRSLSCDERARPVEVTAA